MYPVSHYMLPKFFPPFPNDVERAWQACKGGPGVVATFRSISKEGEDRYYDPCSSHSLICLQVSTSSSLLPYIDQYL